MVRHWMTLAGLVALAASAPAAAQAPDYSAATVRSRPPQDEIIYFVLPDRFANGDPANDRGGLKGDRLKTGFDPAHKGFFHGGDLKGLTQKLDYIQRLGVTAIWFAPIFQNKPVQGEPGQESAGYHGYWVTDFTRVDSHFGTNDEFRAFVDAAHARGIKVYMDIITNHTADVIYFKECAGKPVCAYRSKADYPYWTKGGLEGARINAGFEGDSVRTQENSARLTDPTYAYTPQLPKGEEQIKVPAWLNDPIHYHNRGNTSFYGEDSRYGDFVGLDDLMTESPRVVDGFIDIYASWIDRFSIDGFRIDTARHVNPEFWARFAPAMLERARAKGIPNFHIFGEVANDAMDPGFLAQHTRRDKLPAVLDFAFQAAVRDMLTGKAGTDLFAGLIAGDVLYEGGEATALTLPTFLGNHDMGRLGHMLDKAYPDASEKERLARMKLAHVLLMTARGVPTVYYGDEQGFTGDGNDQDAREDMFASRVASYNDNRLVGSAATTATDNFDPAHPLYTLIAELSAIRKAHARLREGRTVLRHYGPKPGLLAFTRGEDDGEEILVAVNTSDQPVSMNVEVGYRSRAFIGLAGTCPTTASAPGSVAISLPAFGYAVCRATPID
ncbi:MULTISPECIES: alpha-amylase family glycosyl hydrolase [Pseudomonadota]|jgi:glycosidase|uniref:alpha-amylase family glycosyl hydrolase n=2 Tax=Pseudomonadota TaxID=1224 RepID=UPI000769A210|nr:MULTISPECIES: alpha-amylase family glycosyl hydrolase [Pseudomonadota]MAF61696.1 alpha-amylase [Blastomonas sp.]